MRIHIVGAPNSLFLRRSLFRTLAGPSPSICGPAAVSRADRTAIIGSFRRIPLFLRSDVPREGSRYPRTCVGGNGTGSK